MQSVNIVESIKHFYRQRDLGLLLLRVSVGVIMIIHGVPKFLGGTTTLEEVGSAMAYLGVNYVPVFWGFMAAFSEVLGGLLLIVGFLFRPACFFLGFTMVVATLLNFSVGSDFGSITAHPLTMTFLFFSLMFIGPGRFSVQKE